MPQYCSVPGCRNAKGGHLFPTSPKRQMAWRVAIKRTDPKTKNLWMPGHHDVVCGDHFKEEDYWGGKRRLLKEGTVPTIFSFSEQNEPTQREIERDLRARNREMLSSTTALTHVDEDHSDISLGARANSYSEASTQCFIINPGYSIHKLSEKNDAVQYLTGFDDYGHFIWFFRLLKKTGIEIEYNCKKLDLENQLFMTLMKLRQAFDHKFLGILFEICEATVSKVFSAWVKFLYKRLKELYIWPSKQTVQETMPTEFQKTYPNTRIIIDSTEIPIEKPADVNFQRQTFSTYKNRNTLKVLVGITPRGVVSFVSDCYGGAASDREIIEQSGLYTAAASLFCKGDVIMADRGFLVQDLFAPFGVAVNTPSLLKGRTQLEPHTRYADQQVASKRVHVERVIGYAKTYKILQYAIPYQLLPLSNRIVYVCFMLTNYRRCIVVE